MTLYRVRGRGQVKGRLCPAVRSPRPGAHCRVPSESTSEPGRCAHWKPGAGRPRQDEDRSPLKRRKWVLFFSLLLHPGCGLLVPLTPRSGLPSWVSPSSNTPWTGLSQSAGYFSVKLTPRFLPNPLQHSTEPKICKTAPALHHLVHQYFQNPSFLTKHSNPQWFFSFKEESEN